jgi:cardiolipin-specific phospholipase
MGNTWKGISEDDLLLAEANLLKRAGLKPEDYKSYNTYLDEVENENYIHCVEIKLKNRENES